MLKPVFAFALTLLLLAGCSPGKKNQSEESSAVNIVEPPVIAVHYFGRHWSKNFITGFQRDDLDADFSRIRADGFNTVIFLVSWGDFQPVNEPCCTYDQRAIDRLHVLLQKAEQHELKVMLRLAYGWTFHRSAGSTEQRVNDLMNQPEKWKAHLRFVEKIQAETKGYAHISMSFMSWEDQWLKQINSSVIKEFEAWHKQNFPDSPLPELPIAAQGPHARAFHGWWDYLVVNQIYHPAQKILPALSYEVRVDREPSYAIDPQGQWQIAQWIDHRAMFDFPEGVPATIYWAPFWGAQNQGEKLRWQQAYKNFSALLREVNGWTDNRDVFIDQFNFVDNTPGYEHNAILADDQIDDFLRQSLCAMKDHHVIGYGIWTGQDYVESPLYNPGFAYGLDGWQLQRPATQTEAALMSLGSGDQVLLLREGDVLSQVIDRRRGRLPYRDDRPDYVCVRAQSSGEAILNVRVNQSEAVRLRFDRNEPVKQCALIDSEPSNDQLTLQIESQSGNALLRDVWLFDHTQFGGLYDADGKPGPHIQSLRDLNRQFAQHDLPAYCGSP